ncbi:hypothetical protein ID866_6727 [Astraeus odoratus]|nr:hypothetical protein ID866_6727 [Astraeus odoratus]
METATESGPALSVLINQIDYTLAPPGPLDNSSLPRVPIIRVYGASSAGVKACVHIHQVYPYFFIEYTGKLIPDNGTYYFDGRLLPMLTRQRTVNRYTAKLSLSLNHAIALSLKRNPCSSRAQYIRSIILVKGVHFYGFHSSYTPFLKIHLADPALMNRAVTLMQSGTIMKTKFCVFESHLSYLLQFMCDFGLYGCGWMNLGEAWQRTPDSEDPTSAGSYPFKLSPYFRQSRMPIEVDAVAYHILNRHQLQPRDVHNKLLIPAPPLPSEPVVLSIRELWDDERRRRMNKGLTPTPVLPVDPSKASRRTGGNWVAEVRWWEELRKRIEEEKQSKPPVLDSNNDWEKWVMTTFDSVEALWEPQYRTRRLGKDTVDEADAQGKGIGAIPMLDETNNPFARVSQDTTWAKTGDSEASEVDVDEALLSSQDIDQMMARNRRNWIDDTGEDDDVNENENAEDAIGSQHQDDIALLELQAGGEDSHELAQGRYGIYFHYFLRVVITCTSPFGDGESTHGVPNRFSSAWHRLSKWGAPICAFFSRLTTVPRQKRSRSQSRFSSQPSTPRKFPRRSQQQSTVHDNATPASSPVSDTTAMELPEDVYNPFLINDDNGSIQITTKCQVKAEFLVGVTQNSMGPQPVEGIADARAPRASYISGTGPQTYHFTPQGNGFVYAFPPPSASELLNTIEFHGLPRKIYRNPFYSKTEDVPDSAREYAGLVYHLKGSGNLHTLEEWQSNEGAVPLLIAESSITSPGGWEYASCPPNHRQIKIWLKDNPRTTAKKIGMRSQIEGRTQMNIYGLKSALPKISGSNTREGQHMTILSMEVFAPSRGGRLPDANVDEITAIFYALGDDNPNSGTLKQGILVLQSEQTDPQRLRGFFVEGYTCELDLINRFIDVVVDVDPDIVLGWEVQAASWGYLSARGNQYGIDVAELISRAPSTTTGYDNDQWDQQSTTTFKVAGRHVFNVWRILRTEQNLNTYTFENVVFHVLRRRSSIFSAIHLCCVSENIYRVPHYKPSTLTEWFNSPVPAHTSRVLRYFLDRTLMNLDILEESQTVTKTAEFARVFGVDFYSVISRGSQFKVESFMFRITKPECFVLLSPSRQDVGKQNAAECMPLIMEPLSAFYNGPLVVLDFQSLYPSVMIAYNYCYSTCLGRIADFQGRNKFGVTDLQLPAGLLEKLQDHITIAPNGIVYVKPIVRQGVLGRMLTELLDTRVMVKQAMKNARDNKLGLKYIANVTYGYTSATYSGRMPAVEIADSIVQSGRETLEKTIDAIDGNEKWGARVVYGDTDSLFVYLKGKTKEQAFRIGQDIAETITALNPAPIKLKFEKVYLPCVLLAKKRYVGFKFESPDEEMPTFDAKGIETVRRDGVMAQSKMTETCLKILFRTQDLSEVKQYCHRTWSKILRNKVSIQDFIFAKEVRMGTYSDKGPPPPGVTVAARRMLHDPNDEPQYGERVPYIIARGNPHTRLVERAVTPEELLTNPHMHIDAVYYIEKVLIPPLERIFNLVGADVRAWYEEMPKAIEVDQRDPLTLSPKKAERVVATRIKIDEHFQSSRCLACSCPAPEGQLTSLKDFIAANTVPGVCEDCLTNPQQGIPNLMRRLRKGERKLLYTHRICAHCTANGLAEPIECFNTDCPWLYERKKAERKTEFLNGLQTLVEDMEFTDGEGMDYVDMFL